MTNYSIQMTTPEAFRGEDYARHMMTEQMDYATQMKILEIAKSGEWIALRLHEENVQDIYFRNIIETRPVEVHDHFDRLNFLKDDRCYRTHLSDIRLDRIFETTAPIIKELKYHSVRSMLKEIFKRTFNQWTAKQTDKDKLNWRNLTLSERLRLERILDKR